MSHNILSLQQDRFDTRAILGGCCININGETLDCVVDRDSTHFTNPTYTVTAKEGGQVLCTFRPYHLYGGPFHYEIEGVSRAGGSATLVVPGNGMLGGDDEDEEADD